MFCSLNHRVESTEIYICLGPFHLVKQIGIRSCYTCLHFFCLTNDNQKKIVFDGKKVMRYFHQLSCDIKNKIPKNLDI